MEKLTLKEIADALGGECSRDVEINGVCIDTRKITKGCLFICIKGARFDGHDFAAQALALGAAAVMIHRDVDIDGAYVKVADTSKALLALGGYYRSKFNIPLVGLTGSVGKTTTKEFTYLVLSAKYKTVKTLGNLNNEIGLPQMLFALDSTTQAAVIEMGMNHFGEIHRLTSAAKPTVAMITNIGVSHIENLGSREGILKAKLEILDGLAPGSPLIINGDNDMLATVLDNDEITGKYDVITFGIESPAQYRAENINENDGKTSFEITWLDMKKADVPDGCTAEFAPCSQTVTIPTVGTHNVYNALAAFAAGMRLGVEPELAAKALAEYEPEGMRQRSVSIGGITSIEDCYNASPDSMHAAIKTLADMKAGKKIAVLGDMLELGDYSKSAHYEVGKFAAENNIDFLLAYGDEAASIVDGARQGGMKNALHFADKEQLSQKLIETASPGDAVIFKASRGMKLEDVIHYAYDRWGK